MSAGHRRGLELSEEAAHAAALRGLPGMTPTRLAAVLDGLAPVLAWRALAAGTHPADPARALAPAARSTDVAEVRARYRRARVSVLLGDTLGFPPRLVGDRGQPAVLFATGDPRVADARPAVALVGTRSATPYGRSVATQLGADLAAAGLHVVSGLARGIDGAAHAGVVRRGEAAGRPIAVVGTGLDVVYPRSQADLWRAVSERGTVLSEAPLGTPPSPGVFPARNRIIAALADVVVVVECHHRGGSLYTAEAAARRGIPVGAVPGSVRSAASSGCHALLADGCFPVRDAADVLAAVELARADPVTPPSRPRSGALPPDPSLSEGPPARPPPRRRAAPADHEERQVWDAVDDHPTTLETILRRTGLSIATVALVCEELVSREDLLAGPGWWSRP